MRLRLHSLSDASLLCLFRVYVHLTTIQLLPSLLEEKRAPGALYNLVCLCMSYLPLYLYIYTYLCFSVKRGFIFSDFVWGLAEFYSFSLGAFSRQPQPFSVGLYSHSVRIPHLHLISSEGGGPPINFFALKQRGGPRRGPPYNRGPNALYRTKGGPTL